MRRTSAPSFADLEAWPSHQNAAVSSRPAHVVEQNYTLLHGLQGSTEAAVATALRADANTLGLPAGTAGCQFPRQSCASSLGCFIASLSAGWNEGATLMRSDALRTNIKDAMACNQPKTDGRDTLLLSNQPGYQVSDRGGGPTATHIRVTRPVANHCSSMAPRTRSPRFCIRGSPASASLSRSWQGDWPTPGRRCSAPSRGQARTYWGESAGD